MRIIIAGSRDFNDYDKLKKFLLKIGIFEGTITPDEIEIVSGTARGADQLGERFAEEWDLKCSKFPADWDRHGKSAGYKRNEQMAEYAKEDDGILVACWDGKSKGTGHMIDLARKHGLDVYILNF